VGKVKQTPEPKASKPKTAKEPRKTISKQSKNNTNNNESSKIVVHCSYCGKPSSKSKVIIAGPPPANSFICDECLEVCNKLLLQEFPLTWYNRLVQLILEPKREQIIPLEKRKKEKGK